MIQPQFDKTFEGWRAAARELILAGTAPQKIHWTESTSLLSFETTAEIKDAPALKNLTVPPEFMNLAESVAYARDEDRWQLLYRILFRLQHENPNLMKISVDSDIHRALLIEKSVRRDVHKMHAFVRFKLALIDGEEHYIAWHKPEHPCVRPATPFFARRFGDKKWSIFTPEESAHWDLQNLTFGPGMAQHQFQTEDEWDEVWKTYYKSIFNPARIKIKMMKSEMSPKYWASMPETSLIRDLVREAPLRLQTMAQNQNRSAEVDARQSLSQLREKAKGCRACPLFSKATQTVFGFGDERAEIMIVGEQPGDIEDLEGRPFMGPSGEVLREALEIAGLDHSKIYVTNAVKHFKYIERGKARIHQKPSGSEMHACKPWLEAEIEKVKPKIIIALGTTAGTAIMGRLPKISSERGKVFTDLGVAPKVILSWHPAAILRALDPVEQRQRRGQLAEDIRLAVENLRN